MKRKALIGLIIGSVLAGLSGVLIKNMVMPPTSMAWVRMFIPTFALGLWMWYKGLPFFRKNNKVILTASSLNAIRMYFFFIAFIYTSLSNAVVVFYTWPIFAMIFSHFILKEQITRRTIGILTTSFLGIVIVYSSQDISLQSEDFVGISASLLSSFFYSLMVVIFKQQSTNLQPSESVFYQNFVGAVVYLPFIITNIPRPTQLDIVLSTTHGIGVGIVVFYLFFFGLKQLKASTTSIVTYVEIISAVTVGIIFFDEVLTWNIIVGGAMILGATSLLRAK